MRNIQREYDYRTLNDPLTAPRRRDDYNFVPPLIPYPTRGGPSDYRKVGTLIDKTADNDSKYKFLFIYGRQKWRGSSYYEYYVTTSDKDENLKFDLPKVRTELLGGESVTVDELSKTYDVTIDKTLDIMYDPYVFY
jgi:hypothetical protein